MEPLTLFVIAYLVGKGLASGSNNVKKAHDTNKVKLSPKKNGDKGGKGTNVAAAMLTAGTAVYTFGSGFKHGWKEAWPEARQVVTAQRAKNRALKEAKAKGDAVPTGDGRPPLTGADGAGLVPPPRPGDPPSSTAPDGMVPAPPSFPPTVSGPASAGPFSSTPGSSTVTTPGNIEVRSVDTLVIWLEDTLEFANRERDDAVAAVRRIRDLEGKVENAYSAAASAKYDRQVLTKLASLREQLAKLRTARDNDAGNSADAAGNSEITGKNVLARHGGINEAVAAAPVDMAESTTYID
ncbi:MULTISPECIES: hypothetical protein [unclassified Streptomyces]|uniref:hypothetical protein n=1 Tax=unclassified Streptomyces TaxID=2593676 RepID=UPI0029B9FBF7|nr:MULTISPECIES: hypothetical protein [unclassified Streptomyces]MDX3771237.1 hypothetical protein [Streptomyces sp. AK08-01B]MDX3820724.1 hypothetical protein [Streptomyces sp. AK08-01A]